MLILSIFFFYEEKYNFFVLILFIAIWNVANFTTKFLIFKMILNINIQLKKIYDKQICEKTDMRNKNAYTF